MVVEIAVGVGSAVVTCGAWAFAIKWLYAKIVEIDKCKVSAGTCDLKHNNIRERLADGDRHICSLVESNQQLSQSVALLAQELRMWIEHLKEKDREKK